MIGGFGGRNWDGSELMMLLCERTFDSLVQSIDADYKTLDKHKDTASTHL
jgi:hypothetical protein